MYQMRELLSRKVAGIPVAAILAIAAAGLLFLAVRMKPMTDDTETVSEDIPEGDASGGELENRVFEASPASASVVAVAVEDTNELWGKRVRSYLMTIGVSPADAERTVSKYLNATPLTTQERAWIDQGIAQYGFPPEDIDWTDLDVPDPATPTPTPNNPDDVPGSAGTGVTPPTKQGVPPLRHKIVNRRDDGPGELARLYYGSNAPGKVNTIEAANIDIGPGPWAIGTKVKIPKEQAPEYFKATAAANGAGEIAHKNGTTAAAVKMLNPGMNFPVKIGTKVRVK